MRLEVSREEKQMASDEALDTFTFTVEEKIGLKDYSNILVRASLSRQIPDDEDARKDVINIVENILVMERRIVLEDLGVEVKS